MLLARNLFSVLEQALTWSPVILLAGPRQSGKTTLVKQLGQKLNYSFISFDDFRTLAAAKNDMVGFVNALTKPVIIDEVQRIPEIFLSIKHDVDTQRTKGRYLLTGSANPLDMSSLGDSLSGRMLIFQLLPLSQGEINGRVETFIDTMFDPSFFPTIKGELVTAAAAGKDFLSSCFITGGFPDMQGSSAQKRHAWFNAYLITRLQHDINDLARIEGLTVLPDLMMLLAARVSSLLNMAELARSSKIASSTLQRYIALFKTLYLIELIPAWHANLSKRLVKAPKLYCIDSGLTAYLLGADQVHLTTNLKLFGSLLENFVVNELMKQMGWSTMRIKLYHFRTTSGIEVDFILENFAGDVVGIEIKSSETVQANDFKGLKQLKDLIGDRFRRGVVLYTGDEELPFGDKLCALPVQALWNK